MTIPLELRRKILRMYTRGDGTRQEIADMHGVSLGMIKKLLSQKKKTGRIAPRHEFSGRKNRIITPPMRRKLGHYEDRHPEATLKELRTLLRVECTLSAIYYALPRVRLNHYIKKRRLKRECPGENKIF